jgi:hypothetical protein
MSTRWVRATAATVLVLFVFGCAHDAATKNGKLNNPAATQIDRGTFAGFVDKIESLTQTVTVEHWPL